VPLYAYRCVACGRVLEDLRTYQDRDHPKLCPCLRGRMLRQVSAPHGHVRNPAAPRRERG